MGLSSSCAFLAPYRTTDGFCMFWMDGEVGMLRTYDGVLTQSFNFKVGKSPARYTLIAR
jgi:hypothetical protein